eukprot:ANDGO_05109.mRNA.1 hypothetical protein
MLANDPGEHRVQVVAFSELNDPGAHEEQVAEPEMFAKYPAVQREQDVDPLVFENEPMGHCVHTEAFTPLIEPAEHAVHADAPLAPEYVPAGHVVHEID